MEVRTVLSAILAAGRTWAPGILTVLGAGCGVVLEPVSKRQLTAPPTSARRSFPGE
jgi:hypothetical protein